MAHSPADLGERHRNVAQRHIAQHHRQQEGRGQHADFRQLLPGLQRLVPHKAHRISCLQHIRLASTGSVQAGSALFLGGNLR